MEKEVAHRQGLKKRWRIEQSGGNSSNTRDRDENQDGDYSDEKYICNNNGGLYKYSDDRLDKIEDDNALLLQWQR